MARVPQQEQLTVREQAAWWITELQEATPETERRFADWLKQSPRHVEEFLFFDTLWQQLDGVDQTHGIDVERIIAQAGGRVAVAKVTPFSRISGLFQATGVPHARSRVRRTGILAAVAAGVVLSIFSTWAWLSARDTYATTVGEQRAVKLDDGSFIYLNTQSQVEVGYTARERNIRLLAGEALFSVQHDASRPFRVHSGDTVVQAVGTQFNVYRRKDQTTVSVVEGTVQISGEPPVARSPAATAQLTPNGSTTPPLRVTAGEQADITTNGRAEKRPKGDIEKAIAWRTRRLVFRSESLADVADQFNRYNAVKIRVEGSAVRNRKLIGTFNADDPTSLAKFLAGESDLRVRELDGELVIEPR